MNLPNAITVGRIFLVPLLVVVLLTKFEGRLIFGVQKELVGAAIFGLASLTDWLDGYLARRRQQVTTLGQFMDPLADKLLITAALVSLVQMDLAPAWMVAVILGQDHLQQFYVIGTVALWVAMLTATISGIDYYRRFAQSGL